MKKLSIILAFLIILSLWLNGYAISSEITPYYPGEKEILVKYKDEAVQTWGERLLEPDTGLFFSQENTPVAEDFLPELGVVRYKIPHSLSIGDAIKAFETDERVQIVTVNDIRSLEPQITESFSESCSEAVYDEVYQNPLYDEQWAIQQFCIREIWEKIDENKLNQITVAVLDTGVDLQHEDLKDALVEGYNFIGNNEEPIDDVGHGTQVAGIVGAINNDKGIVGVAPGVKIMPVKVLDSQGTGDVMTEIKGIVWAVNNGANVINLSLGGRRYNNGVDAFNPIEYAAIQYAIGKGVIVVAAAGNYSEEVSYPAAYPDVIAVTSVNQLGEISPFANYGSEVSIAAPGEDLYSTMLGDSYQYSTGTSFSAPFISGISALILAKNNQLAPYEVKQFLEAGADDKGNLGKDDQYGYGVTNPQKSIGLPLAKIKSSESNVFYPGRSLQFFLHMEDIEQTVQSLVYSDVCQDVYSFIIDFNKSYGAYYYGDYSLVNSSVVNFVYGEGEQSVLLNEPGFYETRTRSLNQGYAGNRYKFSLFPEAPKANIESGYYNLPIDLTLTTSTVPGSIYYTTNGESPLKDGKLHADAKCYTGPVKIAVDTDIKAVTVSGRYTSTIASYWYGQPLEDFLIGIEEENQIIETDNYILEVTKKGSGNIYKLILKDYIREQSDQFFIVNLDIMENSGSSNDKLQLPKETIQKLAEFKKNLKIKFLDAEIVLPQDQIEKIKKSSIDYLELEFVTLIKETAERYIQLFEVKDGNNSINLASNIIKIDIKFFKDEEQICPEETCDIKIVLTINMTNEESQEKQWYDFRKMGIFYLVDEKYYEYLGGELDLNNQNYSIEIEPEKLILFIAENNRSFEDVQGHWAQRFIEVLASRQIVQGINEKEFLPDEKISRAEFTTMLIKEIDRGESNFSIGYNGFFKDVPEEAWYSYYIERAKEIGLIHGTTEDCFEPEKNLSREEAFVILMQIYEMTKKENGLKLDNWRNLSLFNEERVAQKQTVGDMNHVSDWAKPFVLKGMEEGIYKGYPDGTIRPQQTLTRAEASTLLLKLLEISSK